MDSSKKIIEGQIEDYVSTLTLNAANLYTDTKDLQVIHTTGNEVKNGNLTLNNDLILPNIVQDTTGSISNLGISTVTNRLVTIPIDESLVVQVRNITGSTITKGTVVYINGASGNKPTITKSLADSNNTTSQVLGVTQTDISTNSNGYAVISGTLNNLNTSSFLDGDLVYLSATTPGALTTIVPTSPNHRVFIGTVSRSHSTQGSIVITVRRTSKLDETSDVAITTPSNNDVLTFETSSELWKNKSISTFGFATDSSVIHITGNETKSGIFTMTSIPIAPGYSIPGGTNLMLLTADGTTVDYNTVAGSGQVSTGARIFTSFIQGVGNTINIGVITGLVVDNETNPGTSIVTIVNYAGGTNIAIPTIGSGIASYVTLNSAGALQFYTSLPDAEKRRKEIYLGKIGHPTGTVNIVAPEPDISIAPLSQLRDWMQAITYINRKVTVSPNGANLALNLSAGVITGTGINYVNNKWKPNDLSVSAASAFTMVYRTQNGNGSTTAVMLPGNYDVSGTITAIPGSPNRATLQYIWFVPNGSTPVTGGSVLIQYGQKFYTTLGDAIGAIGKETRVIYPSLVDNAILLGVMAITSGATNLQDITQAQFFPASKFGEILAVAAGSSIDSRPYKSYVAIISQSGTSAPTVLTRENTIGAIVWSRNGVGDYLGTLSGAFTLDKTSFNITKSPSGAVAFTGLGTYSLDPINTIQLKTFNSSGTATDSLMSGWYIEVRVYN